MNKKDIKSVAIFIFIVIIGISLLTFISRFIRKTNRETREIQRRASEPQKVITDTQPTEKKDSLSDLRKSIETYNKTASDPYKGTNEYTEAEQYWIKHPELTMSQIWEKDDEVSRYRREHPELTTSQIWQKLEK